MKRNEIKDSHELSVIDSFKNHSASINNTVELISRPEPPDAIVKINEKETWIEITDAFFSKNLAESITTNIADDKVHKPVQQDHRFCINPDEHFSDILESVIVNKYDKVSLGNVYKEFGSGILLVGIINPFSSANELVESEKNKIINAIKSKEQRFNSIYLYDVYDHIFHKLL